MLVETSSQGTPILKWHDSSTALYVRQLGIVLAESELLRSPVSTSTSCAPPLWIAGRLSRWPENVRRAYSLHSTLGADILTALIGHFSSCFSFQNMNVNKHFYKAFYLRNAPRLNIITCLRHIMVHSPDLMNLHSISIKTLFALANSPH